MGYTFVCDDCGNGYNHFPPFAGEFAQQYDEGQKVTLCAECMGRVL